MRHVAVEYVVHPVIVGKRALPAIGLTGASGPIVQLDLIAEPDDIVIAFGEAADGPELGEVLAPARARGCLTVASRRWAPSGSSPPSDDPLRQEVVETLYHVLWELVHVFFEHQGAA